LFSIGVRDHGAPWLLALATLGLGLVWLGSEGTYIGDERYYTDAVLRMRASGDWWRPEFADGSPRVNKPLLIYWLMGASMQAFGVSLFAARLPFLIAGALLVPATASVARGLFPGQPEAPLLAAAIAASNTTLSMLATRCTPDMLLVLSVTIAWIGLVEFLGSGRPARRAAFWLWGGIGLAAASKGSLAVVLLLFAVAACARSGRAALRGLAYLPALLVGVSIAAVALMPLWISERSGAGPSFVEDQLATRLAGSPSEALWLAASYLGSTARHCLPWTLLPFAVLALARQELRTRLREHRQGFLLVGCFTAVLWLVFSSGNVHRARYMSPAYPLIAAALSVLVLQARSLRGVALGLRGLTWIIAAVCTTLALVLARVDVRASAGAAAVAVAAVGLAGNRRCEARGLDLALSMLGLLLLAAPGMRATFKSDYWGRAAMLERLDATWGFDPSTPSIVRVLSAGRLDPRPLPTEWNGLEEERGFTVLVQGDEAAALAARDWRIEPCGFRAGRLGLREALAVCGSADPYARFARAGVPVFVARQP